MNLTTLATSALEEMDGSNWREAFIRGELPGSDIDTDGDKPQQELTGNNALEPQGQGDMGQSEVPDTSKVSVGAMLSPMERERLRGWKKNKLALMCIDVKSSLLLPNWHALFILLDHSRPAVTERSSHPSLLRALIFSSSSITLSLLIISVLAYVRS